MEITSIGRLIATRYLEKSNEYLHQVKTNTDTFHKGIEELIEKALKEDLFPKIHIHDERDPHPKYPVAQDDIETVRRIAKESVRRRRNRAKHNLIR